MKKYYIINVWKGIACLFIFLSIAGCEESVTPIPNHINLKEELAKVGVKGFAIDTVYTEFSFYNNERIDALRKGVVADTEDDFAEVRWDANSPRIEYNGGSTITYTHNGLRSRITRDNYGFISTVENRIGSGNLHSKVDYKYHPTGYLNYVVLERPGLSPEYITFVYPDQNGGITIKEAGLSYSISLQSDTENIGYVCNVLRYANAPLTNTYVIDPDLYYLGLYGMPIRSLPNEEIRSGKNSVSATILSRVGNNKFFYK
jgi:hypothetical protein